MRLRRAIRRLVRRPIALWYHPTFRTHLSHGAAASVDPLRAQSALTWAFDAGVLTKPDVHQAPELSWSDAALCHTPAYLASLDRPVVLSRITGIPQAAVSAEDLLELWRRAAGGTLAAARWARRHRGRAACLVGGFHHAEPDRGGGFCGLNDVAIAIFRLRSEGFGGRIVVIDLDAHPPDGTVACLKQDSNVTILSLGVASEWELPEQVRVRVFDHRVPPGTTDERYLQAVTRLLSSCRGADLAFYLAGADPMVGDPLGGLGVSLNALRARDRLVIRRLGRTPTVLLPAGGYTSQAWRVMAGTLAEAARLRVGIPADYDPVARHTRYVARRLDPSTLQGNDEWITEAELLGGLGVGVQDGRFLDYYTRHGLEYGLTAYGLLPALEAMGFRSLELKLTTGEMPHRVVISALVQGRREPLVDLSLSIRERAGTRRLFIEWLELRDPRLPFSDQRPRLPGQERPGLGLAEEIVRLIVQAASRLNLDGVSFIPAHYHIAWIARKQFIALNPEARGRLAALHQHLHEAPLREASQLMEPSSNPIPALKWTPTELVLPLSEAMRAQLAEGDAQAVASREAWETRLRALDLARQPEAPAG